MNKETESFTDTWHPLSRFFHWVSAIWIMGLIGLGLVMVNLVTASGKKFELYQMHKSYGFIFGIVLIARVVWKIFADRPKTLSTAFINKAAVVNQHLMLFMTFLLILSGYALVSFSIIPIPINVLGWNVPYLLSPDMVSEKTATAVHHYIAYALTSLILVHSFAALFHHFILKDKTLIRMLKKQNGGATLTN